MQVVLEKRDHTLSGVPARPGEHNSRQRVLLDQDLGRMETSPRSFQLGLDSVGAISGGPLYHKVEQPVGKVCELEPGSVHNGARCIQSQLAQSDGLCLPSICSQREVHSEGPPRKEHNSPDHVPVACTNMVPSSAGLSDIMLSPLTKEARPPNGPLQSTASTGRTRQITTSHLESIGGQYSAAGVSQGTTDLLLAGWSKGTNSTYESAWKRWMC